MTTTKVQPIPTGYHTITPYLSLKDAKGFSEFAEKAFGAKVGFCLTMPDGKICHGEMTIGDSHVMFSEACEEWGGVKTSCLHFYTENIDAVYQKALAAGATSMRKPTDEFYGDRGAQVKDPYGILWFIATHVEDVSPEECKKRAQEMFANMPKK